MHKGEKCWCHIDLIAVKKYNCMTDYKVENRTIYSGRGHIPYAIRMTNGMIYVENFNSEDTSKDIEEE